MTTLYRSVLIESAEQAETLPAKTLAVHSNSGRSAYRIVFGGGVFWHEGMSQLEPRNLIGWTALVPIEAAEEWARTYLATQEPSDAEVEAGKAVLEAAASVFDGHLPGFSEHIARKVLIAARAPNSPEGTH